MAMEKRTSIRRQTGDHDVGLEASVGPHRAVGPWLRSRAPAPPWSRRKWAAPRAVLATALAQAGHEHVAGAGVDRPAAGDSPAHRCSRGGGRHALDSP